MHENTQKPDPSAAGKPSRLAPYDLPGMLDQIIEGDCLDIMRRMPEGCIDVIFADPPYNLQLQHDLHRPDGTEVKGVTDSWDRFADFAAYDRFTRAWLGEARRLLHNKGALWTIGSYHNIYRLGTALQDAGFWIINDVIWHKTNPMPNFRGTRLANAHETLIWAARSARGRPPFHYHSLKAGNEDVQLRSVWELPICQGGERLKNDNGEKLHSTQKPEILLDRILQCSTKQGDVILDPFFGSGTTGAVAKRLRRHFIGIERDATYIEAARRRIDKVRPLPDIHLRRPLTPRDRRVPFAVLVACGLAPPGTELRTQDGSSRAVIQADGTLRTGSNEQGSIHRIGAMAQNTPSCNGWTFWCIEKEGKLVPLDRLRHIFHAKNGPSSAQDSYIFKATLG